MSEIKGTVATDGNLKGNINVVYGKDGASAYELAIKNGFAGSEAEWIESLKGEKGDKGDMPNVDQVYNSTSANPQSGIALEPMFNMKSNTDHVHEATEIRVDRHTPTLYGDSVQAALDYANQTLHEKADKQEVANALKGTASGSVLTLNDVSPVEHTMGVKVSSKNLFDYSGVEFNKSATNSTYVKENNGFTLTAGSSTAYFHTKNVSAFHLKPNTTYTSKATVTLTDNGSSNISEAASMSLSLLLQTNSTFDNSGKGKIYIVNGSKNGVGTHEIITTFTTPADMTDFQYVVTRLSNNTTVIFKDIQIELGTTATDYTPYISDVTAIPEPYINYFFNHHCVFSGGGGETYWAPIYIDKTFEPVAGKTYYVEISDSVTTMPGYDTTGTCTATANDIGGYTLELGGTIRIETCSEGHGETWTSSFRITYLAAPDIADFNLKIGEDGYITKAVKVSRYGKNLFDKDYANNISNWIQAGGNYSYISVPVPKGKRISISYKNKLNTGISMYFYIRNGSTDTWMYHSTSQELIKNSISLVAEQTHIRLVILLPPEYPVYLERFMNNIGNDLQIEIGSTATDYEEFNRTEYTPNADGTVNGVTRLYPCTNLSTNVDGIVIECEYNRDINKAFEELQQAIISLGGNV